MGCAFDKELLTGYYDGELDGAEKAKVERHIAGCSECLRKLGEIRSVSQLVRQLSRPGLPRKASEGIARALEGERAARRRDRWQRRLVWSMAAAAGVFLALNVAYFLRVERSGGREDLAPAIGHLQAPAEGDTPAERELRSDRSTFKQDLAAPEAGSKPPTAAAPPGGDAVRGAAPPAPPAPDRAKSLVAAPAPSADKSKELQGLRALQEEDRRAPAAPDEKSAARKPAASIAGEERKRGEKADGQPPPVEGAVEWIVRVADPARARDQIERTLRKLGVVLPAAKTPPAPGAPIAVEATAEQIARIRTELQNEAGIHLVLAGPGAASVRRRQSAESFSKSGADAGAAAPVPPVTAAPSAPARVRLVLHLLPAEPEKK
jgi:hypothetical protein